MQLVNEEVRNEEVMPKSPFTTNRIMTKVLGIYALYSLESKSLYEMQR